MFGVPPSRGTLALREAAVLPSITRPLVVEPLRGGPSLVAPWTAKRSSGWKLRTGSRASAAVVARSASAWALALPDAAW
jgi:hypothetical protein